MQVQTQIIDSGNNTLIQNLNLIENFVSIDNDLDNIDDVVVTEENTPITIETPSSSVLKPILVKKSISNNLHTLKHKKFQKVIIRSSCVFNKIGNIMAISDIIKNEVYVYNFSDSTGNWNQIGNTIKGYSDNLVKIFLLMKQEIKLLFQKRIQHLLFMN